MKKLVLIVCLAFCASSFAQSVAPTVDTKKMTFQIQPVPDSITQNQPYNQPYKKEAEVDLSVWNHQKDKRKEKSLNWTVADIKKAQESDAKTYSNLTKEQQKEVNAYITKKYSEVAEPQPQPLAASLNQALNDLSIPGFQHDMTPNGAISFETDPMGRTELNYGEYDEAKIKNSKTDRQFVTSIHSDSNGGWLETNKGGYIYYTNQSDGRNSKLSFVSYENTFRDPNMPQDLPDAIGININNSIKVGNQGIIEQHICLKDGPRQACMIITPEICQEFKSLIGNVDLFEQEKQCKKLQRGKEKFFQSAKVVALAQKEQNQLYGVNPYPSSSEFKRPPSIIYEPVQASKQEKTTEEAIQQIFRAAYLNQLQTACGDKFHAGYMVKSVSQFERNNPGAPKAIFFDN